MRDMPPSMTPDQAAWLLFMHENSACPKSCWFCRNPTDAELEMLDELI